MLAPVRNRLAKLHNDQRGLEALQVVVIVAIAAVILAIVFWLWNKAGDDKKGAAGWFNRNVVKIFNWESSNSETGSGGKD